MRGEGGAAADTMAGELMVDWWWHCGVVLAMGVAALGGRKAMVVKTAARVG